MQEPTSIELQCLPRALNAQLCSKNTPSAPAASHVSALEVIPTEHPESAIESQNRENAVVLPPVDGGKEAWTFIVASCVLEALIWGFAFSYGIFQDYYTHNLPFNTASETAIAAVGTICLAAQYINVMIVVFLHERWPHVTKKITWIAFALSCSSLFLSSFATRVSHLMLLQGFLSGVGGGAVYAPLMMWLPEWFVRRRGLAGGIIFAGAGLGGALFPVLITLLLAKTGSWGWTLRIWAICMAVIGGIALRFVKARMPVIRNQPGQIKPVNLSFLKRPLFICIATTIFIQAVAYFPVSLYMPTYTSALGLPIINGTLVLAVFNLASVIGQVVFGLLCDRLPYIRVIILSGVGAALSAYLLWGFAHTLSLIFLFVVVFGGLSGGFTSVWPSASSDIAGPDYSNNIVLGCFSVVKGLAAIVGPLIATKLHDPNMLPVSSAGSSSKHFGGYGFTSVTLFVGGMMVATAAGGVLSWGAKRWTIMIR